MLIISAAGAALEALVRRINFEAAAATAINRSSEYLGGYAVRERRRSLERL